MNMKSLFFVVLILSTIFIVFNVNISYADGISDVISGGDSFLEAADEGTTLDETKLKDTSNMIYKILLILGICIAVIISGILGIKFMIGSVEEKAQVKDQLIPFVVGCVVIFGAFTIWKMGVNIGNEISPKSPTENAQDIISGEKQVSSFTNEELKELFSSQRISSDIYHWTSEPRNPNKVSTVEEAVKKMSDYKQKIYNECKKRGLLNSGGTGLKN